MKRLMFCLFVFCVGASTAFAQDGCQALQETMNQISVQINQKTTEITDATKLKESYELLKNAWKRYRDTYIAAEIPVPKDLDDYIKELEDNIVMLEVQIAFLTNDLWSLTLNWCSAHDAFVDAGC